MGDILEKEVNKKTDTGKLIHDAKKNYRFVDDDIVINLVKPHIAEAEKQGGMWFIEGFP